MTQVQATLLKEGNPVPVESRVIGPGETYHLPDYPCDQDVFIPNAVLGLAQRVYPPVAALLEKAGDSVYNLTDRNPFGHMAIEPRPAYVKVYPPESGVRVQVGWFTNAEGGGLQIWDEPREVERVGVRVPRIGLFQRIFSTEAEYNGFPPEVGFSKTRIEADFEIYLDPTLGSDRVRIQVSGGSSMVR